MKTPRTDEAHEDACGDVDREIQDGWDLARRLEKELAKSVVLEIRDWTQERWNDICSIQRPEALWISGEQMDRLMKLQEKEPLPFSELF